MKITLTAIFLSLLFFVSGPNYNKYKRYTYASEPNKGSDSAIISIPYELCLGVVSEEYKNQKRNIIHQFYNKYIGTAGFSGGFIVAKNGYILFENYQGYSNIKDKKEITAATPLHLASVSKVLTATAILKLVQEDNISLDQKVTDWIPKFPYPNTTIRTLLNHRSGLQHYSRYSGLLKKGWNNRKVVSNKDVLDLMIKHKFRLLSANNTRFEYCNTNYVILALIVERATGLNFRDAMQTLIFKPLGMKDTFVFDYTTQKDTVSKSYRGKNIPAAWDQYDALVGDKNVYSTPRDLVKFDLATYSPDFIAPEILKEAFIGYSPQPKTMKNYGLGIRMKEWPTGQRLTYHNGWWHGSTSSYVTLKNDTITIIALSNKYSTKPYQSLKLSSYFGDYPYVVDNFDVQDSLQ